MAREKEYIYSYKRGVHRKALNTPNHWRKNTSILKLQAYQKFSLYTLNCRTQNVSSLKLQVCAKLSFDEFRVEPSIWALSWNFELDSSAWASTLSFEIVSWDWSLRFSAELSPYVRALNMKILLRIERCISLSCALSAASWVTFSIQFDYWAFCFILKLEHWA